MRSSPSGRGGGGRVSRIRFLLLCFATLFSLALGAALSGCAPQIVGERQLAPSPTWLEAGREIKDGFLVCGSERSKVEVKYLNKAELQAHLASHSPNPAFFDPAPAWLEGTNAFLITAVNSSKAPMVTGGRFATLGDDKGSELQPIEYTELYRSLSEEGGGQQQIKVLSGLLFSPAPILPGDSRQGLVLFGPLHAKAKIAGLKTAFILADKGLEMMECAFPFDVEILSAEKKD